MRRISWLLFATLLVRSLADAQTSANGSVRGAVTDEHRGVLAGVTITAVSPTVPGARSTTTDRDGRYRLGELPPGDYAVTAELAGFARVVLPALAVRAGMNLDVNLTLKVGGIDETVEVRRDAPLLETQNAGQSVNISGELLRRMPLLEKHEWFGALTVAPGVTSYEWLNNERLFSVHGADSSANIVQIDGADMTPTAGSSIRNVSVGSDAVGDIQIKTAGVDASAPLGIGGVINIATASGTNRPSGAATFSLQPHAWNASNTPGGTSATVEQRQLDLSFGGPLKRDRLWGFGTYRYTDASTGVSRTPAQLEALRILIPGYTPSDSTNEAHYWFGKVDARLSDAHRLTGFYQRDYNPTVIADPVGQYSSTERYGGSAGSLRLSSVWSNRWTTRLGASYNDKRRDAPDPGIPGPLQRVYQSTVVSAGRPTGNGLLVNRGSPVNGWNTRPNLKLTFSLDSTLVINHASGGHQLQAGIYAQPLIRTALHNTFVNGGFSIEDQVLVRPNDLTAGAVPFHRVLMDTTEQDALSVQGQDYAFYIQDGWRPTARLTINAGLRVDRVIWKDRLFDVVSQRSVNIGPRLGLNYALTAEARDVVRAHWVRVHDQPSQMASSVGSSTLGQRDVYDLDLDGTFETTFVTPPTFGVTRGRTINPDLHLPFINEWGTGYSKQFDGHLSINADVVHRDFRDRPGLVETNGRYDGNRFVGYIDEAFNETYLATNNEWNWPVYTSFELSASKRTSRVQMIGSYVRQWRHMGGTWQPNDPASFIQPDAFANNRGIGNATGQTSAPTDANSLSGTHMAGRSTSSGQWQDHVVRLGVSYTAPWSLLLDGSYAFQSGSWSGPIVTRLAAPDPAFGPTNITLSNGRVVTNPLATVIRFAYPTRGEGQLRAQAFHTLNARIGRRFTAGGIKLDAAIDVFNLTNNGADLFFQNGGIQQYNPLYGVGQFRQLPRSAQMSLRTTF